MLLKAMIDKRIHLDAAATELLGLRALVLLLP
jgi:hypothetical protein